MATKNQPDRTGPGSGGRTETDTTRRPAEQDVEGEDADDRPRQHLTWPWRGDPSQGPSRGRHAAPYRW
jgi:hypothetical protein